MATATAPKAESGLAVTPAALREMLRQAKFAEREQERLEKIAADPSLEQVGRVLKRTGPDLPVKNVYRLTALCAIADLGDFAPETVLAAGAFIKIPAGAVKVKTENSVDPEHPLFEEIPEADVPGVVTMQDAARFEAVRGQVVSAQIKSDSINELRNRQAAEIVKLMADLDHAREAIATTESLVESFATNLLASQEVLDSWVEASGRPLPAFLDAVALMSRRPEVDSTPPPTRSFTSTVSEAKRVVGGLVRAEAIR